MSLLFLTIVLATSHEGIWVRNVPIPWGGEQTNIAHALAAGRGFSDPDPLPTGPTAWVPPVWPSTLALIYRLCGADTRLSSRVIIILQHLLAAFALFALLRCLSRSSWSARLSLLGAFVLLAFLPLNLLGMNDADDLWIVWALLAALLWLCTAERWSRGRLLGFSLLGGISVLTHAGVGLAFFVAAGACVYAGRRGEGPAAARGLPALLRRLGVVYLGAILALAGWSWRNYARFHELIPVKSTLWFELGLTLLPPGHSGVLATSDLLMRHPLQNLQVAGRLAAEGEPAFMAGQRRAVLRAMRQHPAVFARQVWHRAVNALAYPENETNAARARVDLPADDWDLLQKAGLAYRLPDRDEVFWVNLNQPAGKTVRRLTALPLRKKRAALDAWARNAAAYRNASIDWRAIVCSVLYGALPGLCLAWGCWRRRRPRLSLLPYACLAYAAVLTPHILITHYFSYQLRFVPLQAGLLAGALIDLVGLAATRCPRASAQLESKRLPA